VGGGGASLKKGVKKRGRFGVLSQCLKTTFKDVHFNCPRVGLTGGGKKTKNSGREERKDFKKGLFGIFGVGRRLNLVR